MLNNRLNIFYINLTNIILHGILAISVPLLVYIHFSNGSLASLLPAFIIFLPVAAIYMIRSKVQNFQMFLLLNIITIIISVFLFEHIIVKFIVALTLMYEVGISFKKRNIDIAYTSDTPLLSSGVLIIIAAIAGIYFDHQTDAVLVYSCLTASYIIVHLLNKNLLNVHTYMTAHQSAKTLPVKQFYRINNTMMTIYLAFTILLSFLFTNKYLQNMVIWLFNAVKILFYRFLALFIGIMNDPQADEVVRETSAVETPDMVLPQAEEGFLYYIWQFLGIIFIIVVAYIIIYLMFKGITNLLKNMSLGSPDNQDETTFLEPKFFSSKRFFKRDSDSMFRTKGTNTAMRKLYYHTLKKKAPSQYDFDSSKTPENLSHDILKKYDYFTFLYEKARYSHHKLSKEEIEAAKKYSSEAASRKKGRENT